jgi:hypothetical protein
VTAKGTFDPVNVRQSSGVSRWPDFYIPVLTRLNSTLTSLQFSENITPFAYDEYMHMGVISKET